MQGATGPQGPTGTPGANGQQGATGAAGAPGTTSWAGITDKPAVIAAGENAEAARAAISAKHELWTPDYIDLLPGQPLMAYYDETNGWPTSRPVSRTDVPIFCVDRTGGAPNPSWAVLGRDIILVAEVEEVPGVVPIATYNFEGQTNGQPLNINNASRPWASDSGDANLMIAASAAAVHGTLGGRVSSATSYRRLTYWETAQTTNTRVFDCYFTIRQLGASVAYIMRPRGIDDLADVSVDVRINLDRTVSIRNGTSAVATSVIALDLNTTYRFAYKVVPGQTQELRVYAGESTTPLLVLSGIVSGVGINRAYFGLCAASAGFSADLDTIRIADDWLAPYA